MHLWVPLYVYVCTHIHMHPYIHMYIGICAPSVGQASKQADEQQVQRGLFLVVPRCSKEFNSEKRIYNNTSNFNMVFTIQYLHCCYNNIIHVPTLYASYIYMLFMIEINCTTDFTNN